MADDKHYVGGEFYRICDMTGFKIRAPHTRKQWNNIIVREQSWEPRQPQDFVKGVRDEQAAPEPRPRQVNVFLGPLVTTITASRSIGAVSIPVESTGRMYAGDILKIILNNGETFTVAIGSVDDSRTLTLVSPLPWSVSNGNEVTDTSVVAAADINSEGSAGDD